MYSFPNYPWTQEQDYCDTFIRYKIRIAPDLSGKKYLEILKKKLKKAIKEIKPDLIFYNAGTDSYENDPLGKMNLTKEHIIIRDAFVFQQARENHIPIVMALSGGYTPQSAEIIGESIKNLLQTIIK